MEIELKSMLFQKKEFVYAESFTKILDKITHFKLFIDAEPPNKCYYRLFSQYQFLSFLFMEFEPNLHPSCNTLLNTEGYEKCEN